MKYHMKNQRSVALNLIKLIACIMVIVVHVSATNIDDITSSKWGVSNFYNSISRICVPLFFMVSGALLIRENTSFINFIKKRYYRVIPPVIIWSAIYYVYPMFYGYEQPRTIASLFNSPISVHLWYLYAIIGLYLLVPFLSMIYFKSTLSERVLFLAIWFIGSSLLPTLNNTGVSGISASLFGLNSLAGYIGYIFAGKLIHDLPYKKLYSEIIGLVIFITCSYLTFYLTKTYSYSSGKFNGVFYSYLSSLVVLSAFSLFYVTININIKSSFIASCLSAFSSCALGIYCLQSMMIKEVAYKLNVRATHDPAIIWIPIAVGVTFVSCFVICYIASRIKVIRQIV